jgi:hypothetical protein
VFHACLRATPEHQVTSCLRGTALAGKGAGEGHCFGRASKWKNLPEKQTVNFVSAV